MQRKNKIKKKPGSTKISRADESRVSQPTVRAPKGPSFQDSLIILDRRSKIFILGLLILYFILSLSKIHTSSISFWDQLFGITPSQGLLSGSPKGIRQDEWMVTTPSVIGQYQRGMQISNPGLGDGNVPVMLGYPVKDFSVLLKPNLWPYFIFSAEHAFAFSWNFNIFFFIISTFLLFLLLTKNNFWLSAFGAFFIFLSGALQWWSYSLGALMLYLNGVLLSLAYLLYSKRIKNYVIAGIVFLVCSYSFITAFYPPWQVPLSYLYLLILTGYILTHKRYNILKQGIKWKAAVLLIAVFILGVFLYHYYTLVKGAYDVLLNTAYPGRRITNGGDLENGKLFSDFFGMFLWDDHVPPNWLNICEASSFIMFFPILFYCIGYDYVKYKVRNWLLLLLSIYVVFLLVWLLAGFPAILSKVSLLSMSPVKRTLPILGVANCILLICWLAGDIPPKLRFTTIEFLILTIATILFAIITANHINKSTASFFTSGQMVFVYVLIPVLYLLTRYKYIRYAKLILAVILIGINLRNLKVHPVNKGLGPLLENPLVKFTKDIHATDPQARWAVYGSNRWADLLKVNGINVFNGVKFVPQLRDMSILDSNEKSRFVYNRYGHIVLRNNPAGQDSVQFNLLDNKEQQDIYILNVDPCSPKFKTLGIKYVLFTYEPRMEEIRCLTPVDTVNFYLYKRNDQ